MESDELQDVSEGGEDTHDNLRNCQDDFEVRERNNPFTHLTLKYCVAIILSKFMHTSDCVNNFKKLFEKEFSFLLYAHVNLDI